MRLKIKHKIFFSLLLTSIAVALGLFLFLQWNFDRGFLSYVNSRVLKQTRQLAERLSTQYAKLGFSA